MISRSLAIRRLTLALIFVFATAFAPLVGDDQRNYLVILLAISSAPLMLHLRMGVGKDLVWIAVALLGPFLLTLENNESAEFTSLAYTGILATAYVAVARGLHSGHVTRDAIAKLLKTLILLYATFSVFQMTASLSGMPIPNLILSKGIWSYNSLAVEPSHAGRVLALSMLTYLILVRNENSEIGLRALLSKHKLVVVAFLMSTGLTGSVTGLIAATLAIMLVLSKFWTSVFAGVLFLAWPTLYMIDFLAFQRLTAFLAELHTMDITALVEADHSGAMRMMPLLLFLEEANPATLEFWFGGGLGAIASYVQGKLVGAGDLVGAGFIPGYVMAFGVVGTLLFLWAFLIRFLVSATRPVALLWAILFATSAWNSQLFWYGLMLVRIVHELQYVQKRKERLAATRIRRTALATSDERRAAT